MNFRKSHPIFYLIIVCSLCFSCGYKDNTLPSPPQNTIPREKLINVLVDLHLIEASMTQYYGVPIDMKLKAATYYALLYKKHTITHQEFVHSMYYYAQDLKYLGKIYQEVITRLSVMQTSVHQIKP